MRRKIKKKLNEKLQTLKQIRGVDLRSAYNSSAFNDLNSQEFARTSSNDISIYQDAEHLSINELCWILINHIKIFNRQNTINRSPRVAQKKRFWFISVQLINIERWNIVKKNNAPQHAKRTTQEHERRALGNMCFVVVKGNLGNWCLFFYPWFKDIFAFRLSDCTACYRLLFKIGIK